MPYFRSLDHLLAAAEFAAVGRTNAAAQSLIRATEEPDFDDMKDEVNEQQAAEEQQQQQKPQQQQKLSAALARRIVASEQTDDMESGDEDEDEEQKESASARLRRNLASRY